MDSGILPKMLSAIFMPSVFCGILFIAISLPLLLGSIPMNRFYGFRISKAFASDANWYAINKYGAKVLIFWSIVMIASGVLFLLLGLPSPLPGLIPLVICTAAAIGQTLHFSRQLKNSNQRSLSNKGMNLTRNSCARFWTLLISRTGYPNRWMP